MLARTLCHRKTVIIVFAFLLAILSVSNVNAQTTAFTYQGRLTSNSAPASGSYDFQFTLFDAVSGGVQVGSLTKTAVTVIGGMFNVSLDFGAGAFPGSDRYMEISAKLTTASTFTLLTPRQQIGHNPYAIRAHSATSADTATNATQLGGIASSQYVTSTSGNTSFIQNQNASPQTGSNFNVSGDGTVGGTLTGNTVTATTQYNIGSARVLSTDSRFNTFVGFGAGQATSFGNSNVFVGQNAGINDTVGGFNVFIGAGAGTSNTTEMFNTLVGTSANSASGVFNSVAIGANASVTNSNSIVLGALRDLGNTPVNVNVGIGTTAPIFKFHIVDSGSTAMRIDSSATGGTRMELNNTSAGGHLWGIISGGSGTGEGAGNLVINDLGAGGHVVLDNDLRVPSCTGCTTVSSDRSVKSNISRVDTRTVLERLGAISIQSWNYNSDPASIRHIGPMAQDFYAAFGVGPDDKHINLLDEDGVAFAAIQELNKINQAKDQQINDLTKRIEALEKVVEKLTKQQQ